MRRAIVRLLEDSLADRILRGNIKEGDTVTVDLDSKGDVVLSHLGLVHFYIIII